jgi:hypothetical protein
MSKIGESVAVKNLKNRKVEPFTVNGKEQKCEKYYIPTGFPLGFETGEHISENRYNIGNYVLELYDNDKERTYAIKLTTEELELWCRLVQGNTKFNGNEKGLLESLKEKRALIEADIPSELIKKLLSLNPIRQGVGWVNGEEKECIGLSSNFIQIASLESVIWRLSTGRNLVKDVFDYLSKKTKKSLNTFEEDFILAIIKLIKNDVLRLR